MKFYDGPFTISESYAQNLRNKLTVFRETTKTKKHIFLTLISTNGLKDNEYAGMVDTALTIDYLFK